MYPIYKILRRKAVCNPLVTDTVHKADRKESGIRIILLMTILMVSFAAIQFIKYRTVVREEQLQVGIAEKIIRFHVIANSDNRVDQEMKYKVRDALIKELSSDLKSADDIDAGREIIISRLSLLEETAEDVLAQEGYRYPVTVSLEPCYFPMKVYGGYTFPPGTYEALQVKIGKAAGKNWWCVMFPPLCFVDETYSIVDGETEEQIKYLLTEEEYDAITRGDMPVKVRFKLWDYLKKLFD